MPMPTGGTWPPPAFTTAYNAYRDWDALYAGSTDKLREVFANRLAPNPQVRPSQLRGGLIGTLARWFWGQPNSTGNRDTRLHMPLPADIAAARAGLLFAEPVRFTADDAAVMERLELLEEDGLQQMLFSAAEACAALGDVYLRPIIDRDVWPDRAQLFPVHADGALPVLRWGRLIEVTFHHVVEIDGTTYLRLLEHHSPGRIEYALMQGTETELGRAIPLTEHDGTAYLADVIDTGSGQDTGLEVDGRPVLDVVRFSPAGTQRLWRTDPTGKYLGRSVFDGAEQWFDQVDEVWSSWMRDVRLAKARIVIPQHMLQNLGPGQGAQFDPEREVYEAINSLDESGQITLAQFAIRVAEHRETIGALTEVVTRHAGLSMQTMGEQGDMAVTATEVEARERRSFLTRDAETRTWGTGLAQAIELLLATERVAFGAAVEPVRPDIEFGDSVSESPETIARTVQLLRAAESISTETAVRMINSEWDDDEVLAEVKRIEDERGTPADPTAMGDVNPLGDGESDPDAASDEPADAGMAERQADIDFGLFGF